MRKITLTLEIELEDLPIEKREELARTVDMLSGELPSIADINPLHLGGDIACVLTTEAAMDEYLWPGSEMFARISRARCLAATEAPALTVTLAQNEIELVRSAVELGSAAFDKCSAQQVHAVLGDRALTMAQAVAHGRAIWNSIVAKFAVAS